MTYKHRQNGGMLLEAIVVVTIVAILAAVAVPNLNDMLLRKDMDYARSTLEKSLHLARQMALSENTVVDVQLQNNRLQITPRNGNENRVIDFPQRVQLLSVTDSDTINFLFRPVGTAGNRQGDVVIDFDNDLSIFVRPKDESSPGLQQQITVGNYGNIASN